jgi:alpha-beta hydrolase superfamily lysophospholipase
VRAILVTVHGTWAAGAPWAAPDSPLGRAVCQWYAGRGVAATIVPFQWSGRNSIAARRAAGASLADFLDRISRENPQTSLYVIAHSHGGSVFSYATMLRPEVIRQVDGFIALATPWVGLEPCSYAVALRTMLAKLALYLAFAAVLAAVAFALPAAYL